MKPRVGQSIGDLRLVEEIGSSALAWWFRAEREKSPREVVVGVPTADVAAVDLARAAPIAGFARVHALETDPPCVFVEEAAATTLRRFLDERHRLTALQAERMIVALCVALGVAHRKGIELGDLSPSAVLVTRAGDALILDLGVEPSLREELFARARERVRVAPEVAAGEAPTPRSDVWSLGELLRESLGGEEARADDPRAFAPVARAVIEKACSSDPSTRYTDALAMLVDLRAGRPPADMTLFDLVMGSRIYLGLAMLVFLSWGLIVEGARQLWNGARTFGWDEAAFAGALFLASHAWLAYVVRALHRFWREERGSRLR